MLNKHLKFFTIIGVSLLVLFSCMISIFAVQAEISFNAETPVAMTAPGQSPEIVIVGLLARRMNFGIKTDNFLMVIFITIAIALFATSLGESFAQEKNTIDLLTTYGDVYDENNIECMRPRIMGTQGVVSTGHYLSTMAGIDVFKKGGNAFDAGVAAAMALKVMKMGYAGWAGVAPLVLYSAVNGK